jgi:hypothetical protein
MTEENKEKLRQRMKLNNPMHRKDVVKKMKETTAQRERDGLIVHKYGRDHWNYKGNRNLNKAVRDKLYSVWIIKVLERDNFKCVDCESTRNLQVHHVRTLRSMIDNVLHARGIDSKQTEITKETYEGFDQLVQEILDQHTLDDGITYCKSCHEKHDYQYRIYKGVKKE